jgi:hypothetical protein
MPVTCNVLLTSSTDTYPSIHLGWFSVHLSWRLGSTVPSRLPTLVCQVVERPDDVSRSGSRKPARIRVVQDVCIPRVVGCHCRDLQSESGLTCHGAVFSSFLCSFLGCVQCGMVLTRPIFRWKERTDIFACSRRLSWYLHPTLNLRRLHGHNNSALLDPDSLPPYLIIA